MVWYTLSWLWWIYITVMILGQSVELGWEEIPLLFLIWLICLIIPFIFKNPYK